MKKSLLLSMAMASALSGCVVVPAQPAYYGPAPVYYSPYYSGYYWGYSRPYYRPHYYYYPAYPVHHYYYRAY